MDKNPTIEFIELNSTSNYNPMSDSTENLIEKPPKTKPRKKKLFNKSADTHSIGSSSYSSERDGSELSCVSHHTLSPSSQSWKKIKNNATMPVPRPRSISSIKSESTNESSIKSMGANSPLSNKSSTQNSRSVTPDSVSIELSDSEITDSSSKIIPPLRKKTKEDQDTNEMELKIMKSSAACSNILDGETKDELENYKLEIRIYQTDALKVDTRIRHPCVMIHVIDSSTWEYLKKIETNVSANSEKSYIDPILTKEFDFKSHKTIIPNWNDKIVFNEKYKHIITESSVILFELVDFTGSTRPPVTSNDWHRLAWAFIRPVRSNGVTNTGKQMRLQLYKPGRRSKSFHKNQPMVMHWFKKGLLKKYPSTLYVSLNKRKYSEADMVSEHSRQKLGSIISSSTQNEITSDSVSTSPETYQEYDIKWKRFPGQKCKLPNSEIIKLQPNSEGCMYLKFSYNGLKLAAATGKNINIYSVPEYKLLKQLIGHQGLVYTLKWSNDNNNLLTTSSDYTACVWTLSNFNQTDFQILPHPSYVYCAAYCSNNVIITGCYDSIIRVWTSTNNNNNNNNNKWILCQEMEQHKGFISSIAHLENIVLSADSHGLLIEWTLTDNRLEVKRIISIPEIRQLVISNIILHPAGKRLLIQTRDSILRMMDLQTTAVIQWFRGGVNNKVQTGCVLSPCGNLVFSCGEDGLVNVWEAYTAKQLAFYTNRQNLLTATSGAVDYHPHDHIIAFGVYTPNTNSPVYIAQYKKENEIDIGLRFLIPVEHKQKVFGLAYQRTGHECINTSKAKDNENCHMMPLVNIIKRMDSVLNSFKINE